MSALAAGRATLARAVEALDFEEIRRFIDNRTVELDAIWSRSSREMSPVALDVAESLRWAERALALAARRGQAAGRIARSRGLGRNASSVPIKTITGVRSDKLSEFYTLAACSEIEFERAIAEAREAYRCLSRALLLRVLHKEPTTSDARARIASLAAEGYTSYQIADLIGQAPETVRRRAAKRGIKLPDRAMSKSRPQFDPHRVATALAHTIDGMVPTCELVRVEQLNDEVLKHLHGALVDALREMRKLERLCKQRLAAGEL